MMTKHMVQRSLSFIALTGMLACASDPTGDFANGVDHLEATPTTVFVTEGTPELVIVTARDGANNPVTANFSIGTVGAGITVVRDEGFEPIRNSDGELGPNPHPIRVRYIVTNTGATGTTSFTINAGGESVTINARVLPVNLPHPAFSNAAPGVTQTTSLTLPAPYRFTSASVISFSGSTLVGQNKSYNADSTVLTFIPPYGLTASTASVSNVVVDYAPTQQFFTVTSAAPITTAIPKLTVTPLAAAVGDTVVVTAPAGYKFTPGGTGSVVSVGSTGLASVGVSADSSTFRLVIGPSANSPVSVTNLRYMNTGFAAFTANSGTDTLKTPAITNFAGTLSTGTPTVNQLVRITAPSNFRFLPTATVTVGGQSAPVVTRATDSTYIEINVTPNGGAAAAPTVTGIVLSFLRTVSLTLPTVATITPPAPPAGLGGTDAVGTAPTITIPAGVSALFDGGPYNGPPGAGAIGSRLYRFTLAATDTVAITADWQGTVATDMDVFVRNNTNTAAGGTGCTAATAAKPEVITACILTAGTYLIRVDFYAGTSPTWLGFRFTR